MPAQGDFFPYNPVCERKAYRVVVSLKDLSARWQQPHKNWESIRFLERLPKERFLV